MPKRTPPSRENLRPDSFLRLADACEILLDGQLTPAALRREAARGNLVIEKIAGKDFVTPAAIAAMRERCRWTGQPAEPDRKSGMTAQEALRIELAKRREEYAVREAKRR